MDMEEAVLRLWICLDRVIVKRLYCRVSTWYSLAVPLESPSLFMQWLMSVCVLVGLSVENDCSSEVNTKFVEFSITTLERSECHTGDPKAVRGGWRKGIGIAKVNTLTLQQGPSLEFCVYFLLLVTGSVFAVSMSFESSR